MFESPAISGISPLFYENYGVQQASRGLKTESAAGGFKPLLIVFAVIYIADTAQEGGRLRVAGIFHAVGLQTGNINKISGTANLLFDHFVGFRIELKAFELPAQNIHGLVIKMIVDWNFTSRLRRKEPQAVLGIARSVVTVF